jgi:uncharacterized protein (TIGR02145 family)
VNLGSGAYCEYTNFASLPASYGRLYNWYAVNDARKIAPAGWHVPTSAEWNVLFTYLGGVSAAGGKMKENGYLHWSSPNTAATNSSGFTALPTGYRFNGNFYNGGQYGYFWMSTESSLSNGSSFELGYWTREIFLINPAKTTGIAVRCIRDN